MACTCWDKMGLANESIEQRLHVVGIFCRCFVNLSAEYRRARQIHLGNQNSTEERSNAFAWVAVCKHHQVSRTARRRPVGWPSGSWRKRETYSRRRFWSPLFWLIHKNVILSLVSHPPDPVVGANAGPVPTKWLPAQRSRQQVWKPR